MTSPALFWQNSHILVSYLESAPFLNHKHKKYFCIFGEERLRIISQRRPQRPRFFCLFWPKGRRWEKSKYVVLGMGHGSLVARAGPVYLITTCWWPKAEILGHVHKIAQGCSFPHFLGLCYCQPKYIPSLPSNPISWYRLHPHVHHYHRHNWI